MESLKRLVKQVPAVRRLVDQRDSLKARLTRTRADLKAARHRANELTTRLAELENVTRRQTAHLEALAAGLCYDSDGMRIYFRNMQWLEEPRFARAYAAGMDSGHMIGRAAGSSDDIHLEWRVHILLWAAQHALNLEGDFVECGVNTGIFSLAICDYLDFNTVDKSFYLFDTFNGIPEAQMSETEREARLDLNHHYEECFELAKENFAPYERAVLVRGAVPETLSQVEIAKVAYLSIDMNIVHPELAAIEHFWDKLVSGGVVVLDDYGWAPCYAQKVAWDEWAVAKGVTIATLPTGQGLLLKP